MIPATNKVDILTNSGARRQGMRDQVDAAEALALNGCHLDSWTWRRGGDYGAVVCWLTSTWHINRLNDSHNPWQKRTVPSGKSTESANSSSQSFGHSLISLFDASVRFLAPLLCRVLAVISLDCGAISMHETTTVLSVRRYEFLWQASSPTTRTRKAVSFSMGENVSLCWGEFVVIEIRLMKWARARFRVSKRLRESGMLGCKGWPSKGVESKIANRNNGRTHGIFCANSPGGLALLNKWSAIASFYRCKIPPQNCEGTQTFRNARVRVSFKSITVTEAAARDIDVQFRNEAGT